MWNFYFLIILDGLGIVVIMFIFLYYNEVVMVILEVILKMCYFKSLFFRKRLV